MLSCNVHRCRVSLSIHMLACDTAELHEAGAQQAFAAGSTTPSIVSVWLRLGQQQPCCCMVLCPDLSRYDCAPGVRVPARLLSTACNACKVMQLLAYTTALGVCTAAVGV